MRVANIILIVGLSMFATLLGVAKNTRPINIIFTLSHNQVQCSNHQINKEQLQFQNQNDNNDINSTKQLYDVSLSSHLCNNNQKECFDIDIFASNTVVNVSEK